MKRVLVLIALVLAFSAAFMAAVVGVAISNEQGSVLLSPIDHVERFRAVLDRNSFTQPPNEMTWEDVQDMSFWEIVDKMLGGDDAGDEFDSSKVNYIRVLTLSLIPLDWSVIQNSVQQGTAKDFYWLFGEFSKVNFTPYYTKGDS